MDNVQPARIYGWKPDLPDHRDFKFVPDPVSAQSLPASIDWTAKCPPVYDQGQLGSCTGNAIAAAIQFDQLVNHNKYQFEPSRLFIHYGERSLEGTISSDSGAMIRDGIKVCAATGCCPEVK
ncbi:hypothetical protein ACI4CU_27295, partial [Klebsiella pneumoniae]